jgi:hypothetical protein
MPEQSCPDGSCISELLTGLSSPSAVEVDPVEGSIYFASVVDGSVSLLQPPNLTPAVVASGQNWPRGMAIDFTSLFWVNAGAFGSQNGEIRRMYLSDGTPGGVAIVSGLASPVAIAVRGVRIFFTVSGINDTTGSVMTAEITGAGLSTLAPFQSLPRGIYAGANHVYWANSGDGTIMRATLNGDGLTQLVSGLSTPSDVALDSARVYWVEAGTPQAYTDGTVKSAKLDGSDVVTIASGQLDPRRIALSDTHVYWINRGTQGLSPCSQHDGAVLRAPK